LLPDTQKFRPTGDPPSSNNEVQDGPVSSADQLFNSGSATKAFLNPVCTALPGYKLLNSDLNYLQGPDLCAGVITPVCKSQD
jgi:hypothetical protein